MGDPHVQEARRARGFHFDGPSQGLPPLDYVLAVAALKVFDGALAVGCQERAQVADVLL